MSVMHGQRAGLGGLSNEYARGPLRYGPSSTREVPNKCSVEKIRCRVKRVGAL